MANNYVDLPLENGGGGSGVSSLNSLTGALSIAAGSGITVTPSGSTITIAASGGGGGANTSLSNLSSVAVNTDLLPEFNNVFNLGGSALTWSNLFVNTVSNTTSPLALIGSQLNITGNVIPNGSYNLGNSSS